MNYNSELYWIQEKLLGSPKKCQKNWIDLAFWSSMVQLCLSPRSSSESDEPEEQGVLGFPPWRCHRQEPGILSEYLGTLWDGNLWIELDRWVDSVDAWILWMDGWMGPGRRLPPVRRGRIPGKAPWPVGETLFQDVKPRVALMLCPFFRIVSHPTPGHSIIWPIPRVDICGGTQ